MLYWTKELPKEAGWYWITKDITLAGSNSWITRNEFKFEIGRLVKNITKYDPTNKTYIPTKDYFWLIPDGEMPVEDLNGYGFYGPIFPPNLLGEVTNRPNQREYKKVVDPREEAEKRELLKALAEFTSPKATGADLSPSEAQGDTRPSVSDPKPAGANLEPTRAILVEPSQPKSSEPLKWANDATGRYLLPDRGDDQC